MNSVSGAVLKEFILREVWMGFYLIDSRVFALVQFCKQLLENLFGEIGDTHVQHLRFAVGALSQHVSHLTLIVLKWPTFSFLSSSNFR